ncbi:MAG: PAS domain-containing sensor histidine kinase, partial [Alphaproteobacteria bacterium]|nr:PAS domain-containing sensor histidine kinase [Alphaproteobacteria bacterium]
MERSLLGMNFQRLARWRRKRAVQNATTVGLVVLGPALTILTFVVLGGPLEQGASSPVLRLILLADLVYIILVAGMVIQRVTSMIVARRNKSAGSRLHLRLTGVFVALALIPTVLVAVFAVLSINLGFEGWFSERVQNVLGTSLTTAQAYDNQERSELLRDGNALAAYLNLERQTNFFMDDGDVRQAIAAVQNQLDRGLTEVFFLNGAGEIMTRGGKSYDFNYERPTPEDFAAAT